MLFQTSIHKLFFSHDLFNVILFHLAKKLWEIIEPCSTRISNVEGFLKDIDPTLDYDVMPIYDIYGPTIHDPAFEVIKIFFIIIIFVVS